MTSNKHVEVIHIFVSSFHPKLSQGLTGWEVQAGQRDDMRHAWDPDEALASDLQNVVQRLAGTTWTGAYLC